jgi:adiponectin receptor
MAMPRRKMPASNLDGSAPLLQPDEDSGARRRSHGRLLLNTQVPTWYAHNDYILTGYRPVTMSIWLCIESLTYLHNETMNIYTHLVPSVLALFGNACIAWYFESRFPGATWPDRLVFHVYLTTSVICFGMSSAYHTFLCHSEPYADLWGRIDYLSILVQILGSFVSGIYIGFYCEPGLQKLYWTMVCMRVFARRSGYLTSLVSRRFCRSHS